MNKSQVQTELEERLSHQMLWRRVMSAMYFLTTTLAIAASTAATALAGFSDVDRHIIAAAAGLATVLLGIERTLLLRERWLHHAAASVELHALRLRYLAGSIEDVEAAKAMGTVLRNYAAGLPVAKRKDDE